MLIALLVQAAAAASSPRNAPQIPAQPPATFVVEPVGMAIAAFDADGDGRTTRAEMEAGVARSFAAFDSGRTGAIGYIAFADWAERWLGDRNALPSPFEVDGDGDNRITPAELQATFARLFARLDADRDGAVSRKELLTIRASAGRDAGPRGKGRR